MYLSLIKDAKKSGLKLLAVLIDPDKFSIPNEKFVHQLNDGFIDFLFIGGSEVEATEMDRICTYLKDRVEIPIILFPGDPVQISEKANALLFLSLLSGRNPDYLIGKQIEAVDKLKNSSLEIIPTAYILVDGGIESSIQNVTQTSPLKSTELIVKTAQAAEYLGKQLIYLEAGSGAKIPVSEELIKEVSFKSQLPLIVGGGIRTLDKLKLAFKSGADVVVIGNALESDPEFFEEIKLMMKAHE